MTPAQAYARAFVADWQRYDGTAAVDVTPADREMLAAALEDLLCEQEFVEAVKGLG